MSNERPFYMAKTSEGTCVIYDTELEALYLDGFTEAQFVYHCVPDERLMIDVSEILATKWWQRFGERGALVPAAYQSWLVDEIWEAENGSSVGRPEIGANYLHNPQSFFGKY